MKTGRPRVIIDWDAVDNLLKAQCTGTEIAGHLGIHPDSLYNAVQDKFKTTFSAYSQQKKESGKAMLRMIQFQTAMDGDRTLLVWLGKNHLDQSDKSQITGKDGKDLNPVNVIVGDVETKNMIDRL